MQRIVNIIDGMYYQGQGEPDEDVPSRASFFRQVMQKNSQHEKRRKEERAVREELFRRAIKEGWTVSKIRSELRRLGMFGWFSQMVAQWHAFYQEKYSP